jgi:hypothetical protein
MKLVGLLKKEEVKRFKTSISLQNLLIKGEIK